MAGPPESIYKIPKITFDYFDLGEIPNFILCNPNKNPIFSLGGISERTLAVKFNAPSEFSFRADQYVDGIEMEYYNYLVSKRLVAIISSEINIGYFMITDVSETNDGISKYKEVTAQSLEIEMASKRLVAYISGSGIYDEDGVLISGDPRPVTLKHLFNDLIYGVDTSGCVTYIPGWTVGNLEVIPGWYLPYPPYDTIGNRQRSFDISDKTVYDFLMTDVEREYGCVFDFDTVNNVIYIYDPEQAIVDTDIYISHYNLVKELNIKEVTDELATTINVVGGNGLDIRYINPLGSDNIYRFNYFKSTTWMEQDLIDAIDAWEVKVTSASGAYANYTKLMMDEIDTSEYYDAWVQTYSGSLAALNTKLQVLTDNNQDTAEVEQQIAEVSALLANNTALRNQANQRATTYQTSAKTIVDNVSLTNFNLSYITTPNFTEDQYIRLQPFIIESSYVDDNISVTSITSNSTIYQKADMLYRSASAVLLKMSEPKYTFEVDAVNFMQIKEFQTFRDQIVLGARITVEIEEGRTMSAILLEMDINFDDPTDFKMVFGNRLRMDNESFKFSDLLGKAIDSGNSNKVYSQQWNTWTRNYQTDVTNTISPLDTTYGLRQNAPAVQDVFQRGYKEGVYINTGSFVNIVTPALLWNGYPIGAGGGGAVLEGPGIDISGITVGLGGDTILLYYGDSPVAEFTTITSALAAAQPGNLVLLPPGTFIEDINVPSQVSLVSMGNNSTIDGSITLTGYCWLKGINLIATRTLTSTFAGLIGGTSGTSILNDCAIKLTNNGSGSTLGVQMRDGSLELWNCVIESYNNAEGNAIGVFEDSGISGALISSDTYYKALTSGEGKGYAFVNKGLSDWYVTAGKTVVTTAPIGEI
jgi:hypothetical protein